MPLVPRCRPRSLPATRCRSARQFCTRTGDLLVNGVGKAQGVQRFGEARWLGALLSGNGGVTCLLHLAATGCVVVEPRPARTLRGQPPRAVRCATVVCKYYTCMAAHCGVSKCSPRPSSWVHRFGAAMHNAFQLCQQSPLDGMCKLWTAVACTQCVTQIGEGGGRGKEGGEGPTICLYTTSTSNRGPRHSVLSAMMHEASRLHATLMVRNWITFTHSHRAPTCVCPQPPTLHAHTHTYPRQHSHMIVAI